MNEPTGKCQGTTKAKARCKNEAGENGYCPAHADQAKMSGRYYGHVAVFELLEDGNLRVVAGGTKDAERQFKDAAEAEDWIKTEATAEEPRTLQVGRLFVDRKFTIQTRQVTETRTVIL